MSNFPDYSNLPEYKKLRDQQKLNNDFVQDEDREPLFFENVLLENELIDLQNKFKNINKENMVVHAWGGQANFVTEENSFINKEIINKIEKIATDAYGEELEVANFNITKYSNDYGWEVKLFPHYDSRSIEMLIFDLQISSNKKWDIVIEGKNYDLKNNQAVMFSGTNQIHWREKINLDDNIEICLIFFNLKHKNPKIFSEKDNTIMKSREMQLIKETNIKSDAKKILDASVIEHNPLTHVAKYGNIFTEKEMLHIYDVINIDQIENTTTVKIYAQKVWHIDLPESIKDKVTRQMKKIHQQNVILKEISFARYSKQYGGIPILTPHYDNTFKEPRVTLDVQLKSNIGWPIVVEGRPIKLMDNEAITFSGTHQIHWREPQEFGDNDFIEMLFCHFALENSKPITIDEKQKIESKMMQFSNQFSVDLMKENLRLKDTIRKFSYE